MQIYLFKKFLSKGIGVWKKIPSWSNLASFEVQIVKLCLPKCLNIIILQKYLSIVYLCHQIVFKFQIWFWQARRYIAFSIKESWIRDHPFKTSAIFHDFWPLPPYHRHSSKMLMKGIFDPYVLWPFDRRHMGIPLPP